MFRRTSEFQRWFSAQQQRHTYRVTRTALDLLDGWETDRETGTLRHHSGRFFSVEGLEVTVGQPRETSWSQPIIRQPECGILGILVKRFDGVPHLLMQAKMEPGNINLLQLSPTVQATRSNYTRVHRGSSVPYLDYFLAPRRGRVLFDALQSEQGSWFLAKRNRNMVVEVEEDVPVLDHFCWLTIDQVGELMRFENLVNMDSRTVLSGLPASEWETSARSTDPDSFRATVAASARPDARGLHDDVALYSWLTEIRADGRLDRVPVPLTQVKGWVHDEDRIHHEAGRYFSVIGVGVQADSREVSSWSQPMIQPSSRGVVAFVSKRIGGVLHLLVQARTEAGTRDTAEVGATVQCAPANHAHLPHEERPAFLDHVLSAPSSKVRVDVVHSEEGGRFYHAESRYLVVEDDDFPTEVPDRFMWVTLRQLMALVRQGGQVNVEARNLLAALRLIP